MRNLVINEIRGLKLHENAFKTNKWNGVYFEVNNKKYPVSDINYNTLSNEELIRFLVFLINTKHILNNNL